MENIIQNIFFFTFGCLFISFIFRGRKITKLEEGLEKYKKLSDTGFNEKSLEELNNLKKTVEEKEKELNDKSAIIQNLKKYMGLVGDKEYGIIKHTLVKTVNDEKIDLHLTCGFKVTKRGSNKVRISIDKNDIQCSSTHYTNKDKNQVERCKELIDGWYDINDPEIKWIEPDEAMKREMTLDSILSKSLNID